MKIEEEQEEITKIAKTIIKTLSRENSKEIVNGVTTPGCCVNNDNNNNNNADKSDDYKTTNNNNNGINNDEVGGKNTNSTNNQIGGKNENGHQDQNNYHNGSLGCDPNGSVSNKANFLMAIKSSEPGVKLINGIYPDKENVHSHHRTTPVHPQKPVFARQQKPKSFYINRRNKRSNNEENINGDCCDNASQLKRYKSLPSVKDSLNGIPSWMTLCKGGSNEFISEEEEDEDRENKCVNQNNSQLSTTNTNTSAIGYSCSKDEEINRLRNEFKKLKEQLSLLERLVKENGLSSTTNKTGVDETMTFTGQQQINKDRVFINIGGIRHETYRSTLKNIPDTRLSWMAEESATHSPDYDPVNREFFFDRHPQVFSHILNYYRTGNMHVPYDVCGPLFEEELQYWGMDDTQVESCCWTTYRQHRDAQETLKEFEGIEFERDYDEESEPDLTKYGFERHDSDEIEKVSWYRKWQPIIWKIMEDPHSSKKSKVVAYISMFLILLSIVLFCLETMSYFHRKDRKLVLTIIEGFCVLYFTAELVVRFIFCPDWRLFLKSALNWIDFLAIVPFFISTVMIYGFDTDSTGMGIFLPILQGIRVIRVFRIIKLAKHSVGLQILGHTLKASFRELLLLIFFLAIGIIIFSSLVYYCEHNEPGTDFVNIPATFWWAVVTMTTVGYGDMVPETIAGKIIGGLCSICGVLMIALPVPVIVNNFNLYYSHAQARLKLPKKKRRVLCGAANALKGPALEEFERREHSGTPDPSIQENDDSSNRRSDDDSLEGESDGRGVGRKEKGVNGEDRQVKLRMKRFSRRDSNMFATGQVGGWNTGIDSSVSTTPVIVKRSSYAMNKRRSLLPTIATLPEIEH